MNVLIACEESQRECTAFREKGHRAFSCDIQECSGGHPEWHIQCDVLPLLNGNCTFLTCDGKIHCINGKWDLIIAHPPCQYISNAGAVRLFKRINGVQYINVDRYRKGITAKKFFLQILNADCEHIAIENPIPSLIYNLPKYTQIIQPYEHGEPWSKKTCLWLKNLPELQPTKILSEYKPYISCGTSKYKGNKDKQGHSRAGGAAKIRAKTFQGIANDMAEQWG